MKRTPLVFVGHGSPMNAIEDNRFTLEWEKMGKMIDVPRAIVCMSAHWLTNGSYVTSNMKPEIIYDFYGFPPDLYLVPYPAKGLPELATEINSMCGKIQPDNEWGLDHGAWVVLKRMFPNAQIPILQLSIDYRAHPSNQIELMNAIKKMRNQGILFVGSGNIVHNLGMAQMSSRPYDWALEFESQAKKLVEHHELEKLLNYKDLGSAAKLSIPTNDHYRPMLNTMAMKFAGEEPEFFNEGIEFGSVSMLSFVYR